MPCSCCNPPSSPEEYEPFISIQQLERRCKLDNKTPKSFKHPMVESKSANNTSPLVKLPMEIFQRILKYVDVKILFKIRRCSQYCQLGVDSTLEWKEVSENAPEALRAILSTDADITLIRLHDALTNPECEFCPENLDEGNPVMGGFLSLLEGKRACAYCLRNDISLRTVEYSNLIRLRGHPNATVILPPDIKYPQIRTIPGTYGHKKFKVDGRLVLVPLGSIQTIPESRLNRHEERVLQRSPHEIIIPKHPFSDRHKMDSQLGPYFGYVGFESSDDVARRYMTAIPFPFFGKTETHPLTKKCVAFHGCAECILQEKYHEKQLLESLDNPDGEEMAIDCAKNIYKRQTRLWIDDMEAEKRHAREFHEVIDDDEKIWRRRRRAHIFNLRDREVWKELRVYAPHRI
ncbi:hypothetical protein NHQ30_001317 [Ciborinia camelliae]|nr:hypothetical protein NHQ30_001317 [Ciborinia camelliae]